MNAEAPRELHEETRLSSSNRLKSLGTRETKFLSQSSLLKASKLGRAERHADTQIIPRPRTTSIFPVPPWNILGSLGSFQFNALFVLAARFTGLPDPRAARRARSLARSYRPLFYPSKPGNCRASISRDILRKYIVTRVSA